MIRGVALAADSPATATQNILDVASDDRVEIVGGRSRGGPRDRAELLLEYERLAGRANHRAFDDVFQLAHVPGPE